MILKKYDWNDIGSALLDVLAENDYDRFAGHPDYLMILVVEVAGKVSRGDAQMALLKLAVEKAEKLDDDALDSPHSLEKLWKLVLDYGKDDILEILLNKFKLMSPRLLESTSEVLSKLLVDTNLPDDRKAMLVNIVRCRSEWLSSQIRVLEKSFTWEMPVAEFPDNAQVEAFLRGSDETMSTQGVISFKASYGASASGFVSKYTYKWAPRHKNASFDMAASANGTFVTISKTRTWYEEALKTVVFERGTGKSSKPYTETLMMVISM